MTTEGFTTCLWFDGQAEEAAEYYLSVFRNSRRGRTVRYTEAGPGPAGSVMTVEFEINGQRFIGVNGGPEFTFNEAVSFQIGCADQGEVDYYWGRLTDGGEEGPCGWLKDRYGVSWQVTPDLLTDLLADQDAARAARTTAAMMTMKKLDIAALRKAHDAG
ncbi:VOC family protein [Streptomyces sp. NPDC014735]|uniref:VOC family protein n=1 Tax=unclassified Streptomyces TaxID=2593676 RepID=UPI000939E92E|nr:VOC family protein [Streptomyces sp. CB01580]OKJ43841.1 3-demethylubiquinone-9 3-methyltransferase [Streptomyces sp. CB01580]